MLNQETLQAILGIREKVYIAPEEMAGKMNITFFPHCNENLNPNLLDFEKKLKDVFDELKVNVVPYEQALTKISLFTALNRVMKVLANNLLYLAKNVIGYPHNSHYFSLSAIVYLFKRTKIKKGISIVVLGDQITSNLPMQYIYSFKDSSVITILDFPENISENSTFNEHFDTALALFAKHMTNIVIGVDKKKWILYNFNASHPVFLIEKDFKKNILKALIPKIVAPIRPYKLSEFIISNEHFNLSDQKYTKQVNDLVNGALIFSKTDLYPSGKKIDDLPFRNDFYRWIGKLHLDNRNGMSYGFLAIQMPGAVSPLISQSAFENLGKVNSSKGYVYLENELYIKLEINKEIYWMKVPEVWVLSQKSGSDKTHVNPKKDLIKMGLSNGKMILETQEGSIIDNDYKTSFDTQVILAHSVGNAIIASILSHFSPNSDFVKRYLSQGISISHWHGYIHPDHIQKGWYVHGITNPHVACSSPQSAIFALQGKLECFTDSMKNNLEYKGDIHVEPHHGTNICYTSISELANYLVVNPGASILGNSYYYLYNNS
jgi:hypothetical protein